MFGFDSKITNKRLVKSSNMKGGRKNLKRATGEEMSTLQQGQSIMQVIDLRGSNLIEAMDAKGEHLLAIFPVKFQKVCGSKDETGRYEAIESGRKVAGIVTQVLYHDQVRLLKKSCEWPEMFKSSTSKQGLHISTSQEDDECSSDDDGLPHWKLIQQSESPTSDSENAESTSDSENAESTSDSDIENDS